MSNGWWPLTFVALEMVLRITFTVVVLLRRRSAPPALAWITIILALPLLGVALYLLFGEVRLGGRRIREHAAIIKRIQSSIPFTAAAAEALRPPIPDQFKHVALLAESVANYDALGGNRLTLIGDTDLFIQSLIDDIDRAELHCHLLFYIFLTDHSSRRVAEALMRAAQRGVACRLLVDAVGSSLFLRSTLRRELASAGVQVVEALPANPVRMLLSRIDLRNHRKIAVIDGVIGYTGSHNIADAEFTIKRKYGPWVDAMVRVEGPVTWDLQTLFIEDWYLDTRESLEHLLNIQPLAIPDGTIAQVIGTGPNAYNEALRQLNHIAFHTARNELIITTPYFVPDDATVSALCTAARRGVDTILVLPARNDSPLVAAASRSHYAELLDSGVQLYEYTAGLLHAKTLTVDRQLAVIGSANLDRRSFELNFEVSMVVYDDDFASQLRFLQKSYMSNAVWVDPARWRNMRWPRRLLYSVAGTMSPLL